MCVIIVVDAKNSPSVVTEHSDCAAAAVATASALDAAAAADVAAAVAEEASRAFAVAEDAEQQNAGKYLEYNVMIIAQYHHAYFTVGVVRKCMLLLLS